MKSTWAWDQAMESLLYNSDNIGYLGPKNIPNSLFE